MKRISRSDKLEKILIVEDDARIKGFLLELLAEEGYSVFSAEEGNKAVKIFKEIQPDLVLLDIILPGLDGIQILKRIRRMKNEVVVIMISGSREIDNAVEAMKLGAYDYLTKPLNHDELMLTIEKALREQYLNKEVKLLRKRLYEHHIVDKRMGESAQIKNVLKQIDLVSPTDLAVIIQGKSGTGKEVVANLIYQKSKRKDEPLIAVDCGAIPKTLVESELFGYEKGAFTGADSSKKGKFELANNGTLFLDEITNLPFESQAKLLRTLEEKKIHRIGGKRVISIDIRILATTNINIKEAVEAGSFREDLFHRINEFKIILPDLKDRKIDIPILAEDFLIEANMELNKNLEGFSQKALDNLINYHWPGNIRELKNVIKKAVLMAKGNLVEPKDLSINRDISELNLDFDAGNEIPLEKTLESLEKELIIKAMAYSHNNKSKAAQLLCIDRKSLYRKIKKLNLEFN